MFYMHDGRIYGARMHDGAQLFERVTVHRGADGAACIFGTGDSIDTLPAGALPMTAAEVLARITAKIEIKKRKVGRTVDADVP